MYIDDYGNEFKTIEEAKEFYAKKFYEEMEEEPCDILFECIDESYPIIEWIVKKHSELLKDFKEEFVDNIKKGQEDYIENHLWDLEFLK